MTLNLNHLTNIPVLESAITCLINAGRWDEAESIAVSINPDKLTTRILIARGIALYHLERYSDAARSFKDACAAGEISGPLKAAAVNTLLSISSAYSQLGDTDGVADVLKTIMLVDPENQASDSIAQQLGGSLVFSQLKSGNRAVPAKTWEKEFLEDRLTENAHNLAILYYWEAVSKSKELSADTASLWQKAIAFWVYVINEVHYQTEWHTERKSIYPADDSLFSGLISTVQQLILEQISAIEKLNDPAAARLTDDLRMDCWAEFEIAGLLKAAGHSPVSGPLMMGFIGWPESLDLKPPDLNIAGIQIGSIRLPFLKDANALLALCKAGHGRTLGYLIHSNYDRAEQALKQAEKKSSSAIVDDMYAYMLTFRAQQGLNSLKCPPINCSYAVLKTYTDSIHKLLEDLSAARAHARTGAGLESLHTAVAFFVRRIHADFENFEGDLHLSQFTERGIDLIESALEIHEFDHGKLVMAKMVNLLALQQDKHSHDKIIRLFERAMLIAPTEPLYKKNLAVSLYNRHISLKITEPDAARRDIDRAYELAPYDDEIRKDYQYMHGGR